MFTPFLEGQVKAFFSLKMSCAIEGFPNLTGLSLKIMKQSRGTCKSLGLGLLIDPLVFGSSFLFSEMS